MSKIAVVWFRQDLRLDDNPALATAVASGAAIVPLYIFNPAEGGSWPIGGASMWWLHQSLDSLSKDLKKLKSHLVLAKGNSLTVLKKIIKETKADAIYWNRRYEPAIIKRDAEIKKELLADGLNVESFNASLLFEPWTIKNKEGRPFRVFTPYWKACLNYAEPPEPLTKPKKLVSPSSFPKSLDLNELKLEPTIDWAGGIAEVWTPGAAQALCQLERLTDDILIQYESGRNRPDQEGVSRMSPYLHFGEISPRQIWHRVKDHVGTKSGAVLKTNAQVYLKEIGWREFGYHLLYHFPKSQDEPLYDQFATFPWRHDPVALKRWQKGMTGYPLVDAGMRELWQTGWMHNRVRMVVGSFLVKDLLLPWQDGARWFFDTLVDADLASNSLGWQWVAGCGADAAPYYRVFNPVLQAKKFDPDGDYVRKWVTELRCLKGAKIHEPWLCKDELQKVGVELGQDYPERIVDHARARLRALAALKLSKRIQSSDK